MAYSLKPLITHQHVERPITWSRQFNRRAPLDVEIGFGLGEFLIRSALAHPQRDYVGIEQHQERVTNALTRMTRTRAATNIRILKIDARLALERLFFPKTITCLYCLFPCPWPKTGHIKHRLFANKFLKIVNSRMKHRGKVVIVTDSRSYIEWILGQVKDTGFHYCLRTVPPQYDTKFERKWHSDGQQNFYELVLTKITHQSVPVKKDTPLQSHALKQFDPRRFYFKDQTGDITVIFKEMLFDPVKDKAMVHLVVAELDITQHFWVSIIKRGKIWRVCKADGQSFLPTPGVARAIELVYATAQC